MCGFVGSVNLTFGERVLDSIRHRGPDGKGITTTSVGAHQVTFGHRRLAIVDLSPAGHQPMETRDGRSAIVFNGEVYNHLEIRRALGDVQYRGHSDTETVLQAIAQRGTAALSGLNGIFALGFLDLNRQKLLLARDPFGVKPLYYSLRGRTAVFASELRPILQLIDPGVDQAILAELLRLRYVPAPDTLVAGVKKVRPGHVLEIDLSGLEPRVEEHRYELPIGAPLQLSYRDAVQEYGRLFEAAVERQLMADVEIGVLLSGGVDSALVAMMAQRHSGYRMKAYTVGFDDGQDVADETREAQQTAAFLGMEHHVSRIGLQEFTETLDRCVSIVEEPLATTSVVPMYYLAQQASRDVKVVLTGQGADEPLGGYRRYQGELWHRFVPPWLARLAAPMVARSGIKRDEIQRGVAALGRSDAKERFVEAYSVFSTDAIRRLTGHEDVRSLPAVEYWHDLLGGEIPEGVARMMAIDLRMNLADDLLLYTDKITMHHSLECRVPILDLELVRFLQLLPVNFRVRLGRGKLIHKDFARTVLPDSIVNRRKKGFLSPTKRWLHEDRVLRDLLLRPGSRFANYFDLREVERVLDESARGFDRDRHVFLLLSIFFFLEQTMAQRHQPAGFVA